jgi:ABC-type thiamin/hydroxymethylpyrimidine transport system permease subunit
MVLAFNFLITILIELPIIAIFFKRKKRQAALGMALLINIISWSITHIIFFTFDINMYLVAIVLGIGEAIAFHFLLPCNWRKAFIISLIVNSLSFTVTHTIPSDFFQSKPYNTKTMMQN